MANEKNRENAGKSKAENVKVVNSKGVNKANDNAKSSVKNKANDCKNCK